MLALNLFRPLTFTIYFLLLLTHTIPPPPIMGTAVFCLLNLPSRSTSCGIYWYKPFRLSDKWWANMLISTTHFRFRVPYGNFDLIEFLTNVRMVSIIQIKYFQHLLQLVHLMNFKSRTGTLEVGDRKKMFQTPCWKEKDKSAVYFGKIQHRKNCVVKECMLARCSCVHFIKGWILIWSCNF